MATIIVGTYMVRYPLGGNLSWALQYLTGLKELGHDVYMVEKFVHSDSCYDPSRQLMTDDCSYGVKIVNALLSRYGLENKWCFVDKENIYYGLSKKKLDKVFKRADLYIENGAHGAWNEESFNIKRIFLDVDPTFTQIKFYNETRAGKLLTPFDGYYTNGLNIGKAGNVIPTSGLRWKYIFNPVNTTLFQVTKPPKRAPYSTIMNWKSYDDPVKYNGKEYGHKNLEFQKFKDLPKLMDVPMEIAISGLREPDELLIKENGWIIKKAQEVTFSFESFKQYLSDCKGEFSVCKNMYVATSSGWFSDKSAAFMASGRPVVLQETGFYEHLPTGDGLFGVRNINEAQEAIEKIESNYERHSRKAWEIANEYLEATKVLNTLLKDFGIN